MLHLVLYLFLSNSHHSLKQELKIANKELAIYKSANCRDPKFAHVYDDFANELHTLSDVTRAASDKEIMKNKKGLDLFLINSEQAVKEQNTCIEGLSAFDPSNSKI